MAEVYNGDIGTIFRATLSDDAGVVDLSTTTSKAIILFDPAGNSTSHPAVFLDGGAGDGTDGIMEYTTVAGDLDLGGQWVWEAQIAFGGGTQRWASDNNSFQIFEPLRAQGT